MKILKRNLGEELVIISCFFFMVFNAIVGMDTVGKHAYYMACGYSFLTVLMVVLLIYSILNILRPSRISTFIN
jgi:hypothetical protein